MTGHSPELRDAAGGLRTLVLPAAQLGSLPDLAWSLSQHPRARFVVLANGLGGDGGSGGAVNGDTAAMLSGRAVPGVVAGQGAVHQLQRASMRGRLTCRPPAAAARTPCTLRARRSATLLLLPGTTTVLRPAAGFDGFSWPPNALLVGGFPGAVPEQLAPVFRHTATIEDRFAA